MSNKKPSGTKKISVGSGNISFENTCFSLLGISGKIKTELTELITLKGGKVSPPGENTVYLIYDPKRAKKTKYWFTALNRMTKGEIYILKPEIFFCWADPSYSLNKKSMKTKASVCRHYLKYRSDWQTDLYEKIPELNSVMLNNANEIMNIFADTEDKPYLMELYLKWGHSYKGGEWFGMINLKKLSFNAAMAFIADCLNETNAWKAASLKAREDIAHYMYNNITEMTDSLYKNGRYKTLCIYFDHLLEKEKQWTRTGYSDGFFVYSLLNKVLNRAIKDNDLNSKSFFMNYKAERFDEEFIEAAEENELDIEFGLKFRPAAYLIKGATLTFGTFVLSDEKDALNEPLEWEVLKQEDDRVLIMTTKAIHVSMMDLAFHEFTWENCMVRDWLNGAFIEQAFLKEELDRIKPVANKNPGNQKWKTPRQKDTIDTVFLLSLDEVKRFFPKAARRKRLATPYAAKNTRKLDDEGYCCWWLRTNGMKGNYMTYVYTDGKIIDMGDNGGNFYCICPALWLKL